MVTHISESLPTDVKMDDLNDKIHDESVPWRAERHASHHADIRLEAWRVANAVSEYIEASARQFANIIQSIARFRSPRQEKRSRARRLMEVHAHPDDEVSKGAGTKAKYVAQGHEVTVVIATDGSKGSILNPALADNPQTAKNPELVRQAMAGNPEIAQLAMKRLRYGEAVAAAEILGHKLEFLGDSLGYPDSGMSDPPLGSFADPAMKKQEIRQLATLIRKHRPHVIIGYGPAENPNEGYAHPDHHRVHEIVAPAIELAAHPQVQLDGHTPWQVSKHYEHVPHTIEHARWYHRYKVSTGSSSPYERFFSSTGSSMPTARVLEKSSESVTTRIRCARSTWKVRRARWAHASQISPSSLGAEVILPFELFRRVSSQVPISRMGDFERDLFSGVRSDSEPQPHVSIHARVQSHRRRTGWLTNRRNTTPHVRA